MEMYYSGDNCLFVIEGKDMYIMSPRGDSVHVLKREIPSDEFLEGYLAGINGKIVEFDDDGHLK